MHIDIVTIFFEFCLKYPFATIKVHGIVEYVLYIYWIGNPESYLEWTYGI
jgi:hypothetical protein